MIKQKTKRKASNRVYQMHFLFSNLYFTSRHRSWNKWHNFKIFKLLNSKYEFWSYLVKLMTSISLYFLITLSLWIINKFWKHAIKKLHKYMYLKTRIWDKIHLSFKIIKGCIMLSEKKCQNITWKNHQWFVIHPKIF